MPDLKYQRDNFLKTGIILCIIGLGIILGYGSSIHGDFQFDDDLTITENAQIRDLGNFRHIDPVKAFLSGDRPVTQLTFALNFALHGLRVTGYHIFNLVVHLAVVLLIYVLTRKICFLAGEKRANVLALITAAAFGLHPVQSQAVSYISQRSEILASLFYLSSLLLFVKSRERGMNASGTVLYAAGFIAFLAGLGAKKIIITLPVVYLLFDFYFTEKRPLLKRLAVPLPFFATGFALASAILVRLMKDPFAGFGVKGMTPLEYLMTQFRVIVTYIRLIFVPAGQNLDYDFPVSRTLLDSGTAASLLLLLLILGGAYAARKRFRVASFGVFWFFIVIAPTSSIVPVIDVINEHRIYLASWGIIVAAVCLGNALYDRLASDSHRRIWTRKLFVSVIVILSITLAYALYQRNKVWQSKMSLWTDVASKSPGKARANNNLGNCYFIQNDFEAAIPYYRKAIAIDPEWYESYYNIAVSLEKTGHMDEAVYYYLEFARRAPSAYDYLKNQILSRFNMH